jgi:hypothetical protein
LNHDQIRGVLAKREKEGKSNVEVEVIIMVTKVAHRGNKLHQIKQPSEPAAVSIMSKLLFA